MVIHPIYLQVYIAVTSFPTVVYGESVTDVLKHCQWKLPASGRYQMDVFIFAQVYNYACDNFRSTMFWCLYLLHRFL